MVSGEEGRVYDFGELPDYSSVKATLKIIPLSKFSATDTLYIGDKWIYPIPSSIFTDYLTCPGNYTVNFNFSDSESRVRTRTVYWGIGVANKMQHIDTVDFSFCGIPEQINEVKISK